MEGEQSPKEKLHEKNKHWKQIVKLVPCSKVNNLNNQENKDDLAQIRVSEGLQQRPVS